MRAMRRDYLAIVLVLREVPEADLLLASGDRRDLREVSVSDRLGLRRHFEGDHFGR
jgi:hypothetical protein